MITTHDLAVAWGATADAGGGYPGSEYTTRGLPILAGCEVCGATLAPYNSHPTYSGYIRCSDCVGDTGYETVAEYEVHDPRPVAVLDGADPATWHTYQEEEE